MSILKPICLTLILAGLCLSLSCDNKSSDPVDNPDLKILSTSDCKQFVSIDITAEGRSVFTPSNLDCVEYSYVNNILTVTHKNSGFNCCSDNKSRFNIIGDTIIIEEYEEGAACYCLCLFDVQYEISNIERQDYILKIIEPYLNDGDQELLGEMNLTDSSEGGFCLVRNEYPWNVAGDPTGTLTGYSECGGFSAKAANDYFPDDSSCIIYSYSDSTSLLQVTHQNSTYNCCLDSIGGQVYVSWSNIYINEREYLDGGGCDCLCNYDLEYDFGGITPGEYNLNLVIDGDTTTFTLDLINEPTGYYCYSLSP